MVPDKALLRNLLAGARKFPQSEAFGKVHRARLSSIPGERILW